MADEAELTDLACTLDHRSLLGMLKHVWYRGERGASIPSRQSPLKKVCLDPRMTPHQGVCRVLGPYSNSKPCS